MKTIIFILELKIFQVLFTGLTGKASNDKIDNAEK